MIDKQQQQVASTWQPSLAIKGSALLHLGATASCILPGAWPYALGTVALNHLALAGAGLWPRSHLLGLNLTKLPASAQNKVALTIDDGPDPAVTPQVLEILAAYKARASFFCIGEKAMQHPGIVRNIVEQGHTIENHTQHHKHLFSLQGMKGLSQEIAAAQDSLQQLSGRRPRFFRAPAGLRNPFLDPVLHRLSLQLASWTRRGFDTRDADATRVLRRLTNGLSSGDILLVHDGNSQITFANEPIILTVLPELLREISRIGCQSVSLDDALPKHSDS